ncbi:MAG TPA: pyridoxamine 5'-phosphate oxidase family protein [Deltaproteobacteria bacterium]|nr:pyridoxamine 5'-phosphate oxidase family protein [Deltaproteobacteria bacterium]
MNKRGDLKDALTRLFATENLAVLATDGDSGPYASLMSVAVTPDLARIFFVTEESSRKYLNMLKNAEVALLFDNRRDSGGDLQRTIAVTTLGRAGRIEEHEKAVFLETFLAVHPHLESVVRSPSTVLVAVTVASYLIVRGFNDVDELIL